MKNYIKRVIAFIRGIVAGALLYELFARPVLMDFIKKEVTGYEPKFRVKPYTSYSPYSPDKCFDTFTVRFKTRAEAEQILIQLKKKIEICGVCSVATLKALCGIESSWSDHHKGWKYLPENVRTVRIRDGYFCLDIPDPSELD